MARLVQLTGSCHVARMDKHPDEPLTGAKDAAFRHYCSCYPGGKPTYNLKVAKAVTFLADRIVALHDHVVIDLQPSGTRKVWRAFVDSACILFDFRRKASCGNRVRACFPGVRVFCAVKIGQDV